MTAERRIEPASARFVLHHRARLCSCFNGRFYPVARSLRAAAGDRDEGHSKHIRRAFGNRPARKNRLLWREL